MHIRNKELRAKENLINRKIYLWNTLYTFIVGFVPSLIIFFVFLGNRKMSTMRIYTMITYIGLIYGSISKLPPAIYSVWMAMSSSARLAKLFSLKDRTH